MPIPILLYHHVDATPPAGGWRSLFVSPRHFERQMRLLHVLGYRGLSMRDLEPYLAGEKRGKVVGITFDDGYVDNLQNALPALNKFGFTATCYVVSGLVGGINAWDVAEGVPPSPLMDLDQLRSWVSGGMEVGAHTRKHVNLCKCSDADAVAEISGSKHDLESSLGVEVRSFCYPFGEHRPEHAEMVRLAGYRNATTTVMARARSSDDPMRLPRVSVRLGTSLVSAVLQTNWERWRSRLISARPVSAA